MEAGTKNCGLRPTLIGECGIPMDINEKEVQSMNLTLFQAFCTGDYTHHDIFLDAVISALEVILIDAL